MAVRPGWFDWLLIAGGEPGLTAVGWWVLTSILAATRQRRFTVFVRQILVIGRCVC